MKTRIRSLNLFIAGVLVLMAACNTPAQPTAAPVAVQPTVPSPALVTDATLAKVADDYLAPLTQQDKFGGAVMIVRDGKIVLDKGYGFADREKKTPIGADTRFLVPLAEPWADAAAILLQLQTEGKLKLDDSVCTHYTSTCPEHFKPITLRHLLANAGGVPDYRFDAEVNKAIGGRWFSLGMYEDVPAAKFGKPGVDFGIGVTPSGTRVRADMGNWAWLFLLATNALGDYLSMFHAAKIVAPLGLTSVSQFGGYNSNSNVAILYDGAPPKPLASASDYYGAQIMTAADVNKAIQALFNGKTLTPAQLEEMLKPVVKVTDMPGEMSHGLGVYVGKDPTGHKIVAQMDTWQGLGAYWAHYPDDKLTVIVLNNVTDWANQPARVRDVGLELAKLMFAAK